jgi:hypothetical protein
MAKSHQVRPDLIAHILVGFMFAFVDFAVIRFLIPALLNSASDFWSIGGTFLVSFLLLTMNLSFVRVCIRNYRSPQ